MYSLDKFGKSYLDLAVDADVGLLGTRGAGALRGSVDLGSEGPVLNLVLNASDLATDGGSGDLALTSRALWRLA